MESIQHSIYRASTNDSVWFKGLPSANLCNLYHRIEDCFNHYLQVPLCSHHISLCCKCKHFNTSGGSPLNHAESPVNALYCVGFFPLLLLTLEVRLVLFFDSKQAKFTFDTKGTVNWMLIRSIDYEFLFCNWTLCS